MCNLCKTHVLSLKDSDGQFRPGSTGHLAPAVVSADVSCHVAVAKADRRRPRAGAASDSVVWCVVQRGVSAARLLCDCSSFS